MELKTKPDYAACMDRVEAWWDGRPTDRPPITLSVRSGRTPREVPSHHATHAERKMDLAYMLDATAADIEAGAFVAEHFPRFIPALGPEVCATCYGCEMEIAQNTSWTRPCVGNIRDVLKLAPDLTGRYWQWIRRATDESIRRGQGRWITALTDMHTNGDIVAAVRDPQAFAIDYMDDYEGVKLACEHVRPHAKVFYDDLYSRIAAAGLPCCTWGVAVSRGTMYYVSCDFICMISPKMFAETILPSIQWECRQLDRSIFHLDGPGALKHLDALLAIPELNAVQWTYGAGHGPAARWIDVYRRIQAAGKGAEVHLADLNDLRAIMDALPPKGLWLCLGGSYSPAEAEAILADLRRWSAGKK